MAKKIIHLVLIVSLKITIKRVKMILKNTAGKKMINNQIRKKIRRERERKISRRIKAKKRKGR